MCTQKAPYNWADDLYKRYQQMYDIQLERTVLPAIKAKHGEAMLHEFAKRWKNHKLLVRQMWKLFVYLVCATLSLFDTRLWYISSV
jgi:cullin 1